MVKKYSFIIIIFMSILFIITTESASAVECGAVPTDNCDVIQDTTFDTGNYSLLNGINILGNGITLNCNDSTLIGSGSGDGIFNRKYSSTVVTNCTVTNYSNGILFLFGSSFFCSGVVETEYNLIKNSILEDNSVGFKSDGSSCENRQNRNNRLVNNIIRNNNEGINLVWTELTNITQNEFVNNTNYGVHLTTSTFENIVYNNTFYKTGIQYDATNNNKYCLNGEFPNSYFDGASGPLCDCLPLLNSLSITSDEIICPGVYNLTNGISMGVNNANLSCNNVTIVGSGSGNGILIKGKSSSVINACIIKNYSIGIFLDFNFLGCPGARPSVANIIRNNILENNSIGLQSRGINCINPNISRNTLNEIINNSFSYNSIGVKFEYSKSNNITKNIFLNNTNYGIQLVWPSEENNIFLNSFINNANHATDAAVSNKWNISGQGNYWGNYDEESEGCFDTNSDLVCDTPFNITGSAGSKDYLPLLGLQILDIIPIQVIKDVDLVKGKTTLVRAILKNVGTINRNINVSLYFDGILKNSKTDTINSSVEKNVDLIFIPEIAGNNKEIKIEVKEYV